MCINPYKVEQNTPQKQPQPPLTPNQPSPNTYIDARVKPNKNANFGYSSTHPSLVSEIEERKDEGPKRGKNRKPVPVSSPQNTHIFDPSKAATMPPPPKPHRPPTSGGSGKTMPEYHPQPAYDQYSTMSSHSNFEQDQFSRGSMEPEPVIAATKVKPPTAQMQPKAKPIQRYAPPPRLQTTTEPAMPSHSMQVNPMGGHPPAPAMPKAVGGPMPPPPARGRGAPPPRRGAPPPPRGGGVAGGGRGPSPGHPPAPFAQPPSGGMPSGGVHPAGMAPIGGPPAQPPPMQPQAHAPPPPKIARRNKQPSTQ